MTIQDKYSKANSRRYRATHGGIQSNRAKNQAASSNTVSNDTEKFPALKKDDETKAEDDENQEIEPEEEEEDQNYARRRIDTNLDRYHEPEPEPDAEPEPEVDLSEFLRKQAACLTTAPIPLAPEEDDDDVDHAFSHLFLQPRKIHNLRQLSAEEASELSQLDDERKKADASRGMLYLIVKSELRARFSGKDVKARSKAPARRLAKHQQGSTAASVSKDSGEGDRATALVGPLDDEAFLDEVLGDSSGTYGNIRRKK
ncbi:uncharacterized protein MELLADRAFT_90033 [Melampsora larici-populina 98AG31]|uniref:Uncharacterized protein n=1 Tax=Melampsora larici-populina (strain 98AG31 / pathotype 3-4-7) TaxID=747676 RepID=F4RVH5_MELLP|nr:uncharacterized protein MELLADRAFT_90033 [Melampsora larici-populina 98AG31]EGG03670.1 hypothetical protein MELLADRAFT_90033 [Melampsora larici-populina 98AG31]